MFTQHFKHRRHVIKPVSLMLIALFIALLFSTNTPNALSAVQNTNMLPVSGHISSVFGWRNDPYHGKRRFHSGIDIAAPTGKQIRSPQHGIVTFSGDYGGYGNAVIIQHDFNIYTLYGHTNRIFVRAGQRVAANQPIAAVGSSGRATGPHLHFEVWQGEQYVNPLQYLSHIQQTQAPRLNRQITRKTVAPQQPRITQQRPNNRKQLTVSQQKARAPVPFNRQQNLQQPYTQHIAQTPFINNPYTTRRAVGGPDLKEFNLPAERAFQGLNILEDTSSRRDPYLKPAPMPAL